MRVEIAGNRRPPPAETMNPTNGGNLYPQSTRSVRPPEVQAPTPKLTTTYAAPLRHTAPAPPRLTGARPEASPPRLRYGTAVRPQQPVERTGGSLTAMKAAQTQAAPYAAAAPRPAAARQTDVQQSLRQFSAARLGREANKGLLGALDQ